jgi:hypothetical protein
MKRSIPNMNTLRAAVLIAVLATLAPNAGAQHPIAYPAKGQSADKQNADEAYCRNWTQSRTGISQQMADAPPAQQTGPAVGGGQRARGALRGAAAGAVIGGVVNDDAGHGAGVGAAAGVVAGGMRARQERRQANAAAQSQQSSTLATFNQAYSACLEGRGYTVH